MNSFANAMASWQKEQKQYINKRLDIKKKVFAPRKAILLTVPADQEEYFKDLALKARRESDKIFDSSLDEKRRQLSMEFEKENPPPNRSDFSV